MASGTEDPSTAMQCSPGRAPQRVRPKASPDFEGLTVCVECQREPRREGGGCIWSSLTCFLSSQRLPLLLSRSSAATRPLPPTCWIAMASGQAAWVELGTPTCQAEGRPPPPWPPVTRHPSNTEFWCHRRWEAVSLPPCHYPEFYSCLSHFFSYKCKKQRPEKKIHQNIVFQDDDFFRFFLLYFQIFNNIRVLKYKSIKFFIEVFIEMVVNTHAVVRNNTGVPLYLLPSFPPMVTSCIPCNTRSQPGRCHWPSLSILFRPLQFYLCSFAYVYLILNICHGCRCVYPSLQSRCRRIT